MNFDLAPGPRPHPAPPPTTPTTTAAQPTPPPAPTPVPITTPTPTATASATATAAPSATPDTRATSFQAVQDEPEAHSGEKLLVSAYSVLWVILMGWLVLVWRKQASLNVRLDGLERAIDRAVTKAEKAASKGSEA